MDIKDLDRSIARWLFAGAILSIFLAAPMFLERFNMFAEKPDSPLGEHGVLILSLAESLKIALFSFFAVSVGRRFATRAGLEAPVLRALILGQRKDALEAIKRALPISVVLAVIGLSLKVGTGFLFDGPNVLPALLQLNDGENLLLVAFGVFYEFDINLWFRWGILSVASRLVSSVSTMAPQTTFLVANAIAAVSHGLFACLSAGGWYKSHGGSEHYLLATFLVYGASSFVFGLGIRRFGLISGIISSSLSALLTLVLAAFFC